MAATDTRTIPQRRTFARSFASCLSQGTPRSTSDCQTHEDALGLGWPNYALVPTLVPSSWRRGSIDDAKVSETLNRHTHGGIYPGQEGDIWKGLRA
jgi:hypothetical protein